ncbi:MAG: phosphoenolpyruvate carboxylase [Dehalococcoidia bacterium]|nr:phosphoenolpyruvate carboxylase [Dehalococcoidia bacterium]
MSVNRKIPRCMSTQHPDNAIMPAFSSGSVINGDDEILEAYLLFSQFGCQEQMWDFEGKKAVPWVVSELLAKDHDFFKRHPLGRDVFLTFRIPNPEIEKTEAKLVPEILASIPRCYDTTLAVYEKEIPPVFEVILPMTTSSEQLNRIYHYYRDFIIQKKDVAVFPGDSISLSQWLGECKPEQINVIPLFEDCNSLLNSDKLVAGYLEDKELEYQRVFLARSDPALNYGSLAAVLLLNIALQRLDRLEKKIGIPIYPILGVGSAPFRGNFKPTNAKEMVRGYQSCQTFTIQSAFKYDWPSDVVTEAIKEINSAPRGNPLVVDEKKSNILIKKAISGYQEQIPEVACWVNRLTPFLPQRRLRKLHIGLFGYSRNSGKTHLPRAIPFCAALYSIGLPPELLGLHLLNKEDIRNVSELYPSPNFEEDLKDALSFYNPRSLSLLSPEMKRQIEKAAAIIDSEPNTEHREITSQIINCLERTQTDRIAELIIKAAKIRRFLG